MHRSKYWILTLPFEFVFAFWSASSDTKRTPSSLIGGQSWKCLGTMWPWKRKFEPTKAEHAFSPLINKILLDMLIAFIESEPISVI